MALVRCPECGREKVSDKAECCPDCGFGIKAFFNNKKYYTTRGSCFEFYNGFEEGTVGKYLAANGNELDYKVINNKIVLPTGSTFRIYDNYLLNEDMPLFDTEIPPTNSFDLTAKENWVENYTWTFDSDGVVKYVDGKNRIYMGIYIREGDFIVYKIANHPGEHWRHLPTVILIHNNVAYRETDFFIGKQYLVKCTQLIDALKRTDYPFPIPEPIVREEDKISIKSNKYIPKCPTCSSPSIRKVSSVTKAGSAMMFGLMSQKITMAL